MSFKPKRIYQVVPHLNDEYFMPGIQREYVWSKSQVIELFDSIMRNYPIGALFLWDVDGKFAQSQIKYKFIQHYITNEVYPSSFADRHHHNEKIDNQYHDVPNRIKLVLDGQQRLTALYIGLMGSITDRRPNKNRKKENTWYREKLYLNLFTERTDSDYGHQYHFEFKEPRDDLNTDQYWLDIPNTPDSKPALWYEVGNVWELDDGFSDVETTVKKVGKQLSAADEFPSERIALLKETARSVLHNLQQAVFERDLINYHEEVKQDRNRIHEIFLRLNSSGTELKTEEKLLSLMMAAWAYDDTNPIDARKEVNELMQRLNEDYDGEFSFQLRFILRCLPALAGAPIKYNEDSFDRDNLQLMKQTWQEPRFENAIRETADILLSFGFGQNTLRSENALIPIAYYIYRNWPVLTGWDSERGRKNLERMLYFSAAASLNGIYSGKGTTTLENMRAAIRDADCDHFPLTDIQKSLLKINKSLTLDSERLSELLSSIKYDTKSGKGDARLVLSLLNYPVVADNNEYVIDHIFPQNLFKTDNLRKLDVDNSEIEKYKSDMHSIGNLQLLSKKENSQKEAIEFDEWLLTRADEDSYLYKKAIPNDSSLYNIDKFGTFVDERRANILDRLVDQFGRD